MTSASAFALDPGESPTAINESVAAEVRAAMGRRRVNQTQLAHRLGMSQAALSRRLSGETPFDVIELYRISRVLGTTLSDLITNTFIRWSSDPRHLTCENYASENADQLPLDFDAMDRRAGLELVTT